MALSRAASDRLRKPITRTLSPRDQSLDCRCTLTAVFLDFVLSADWEAEPSLKIGDTCAYMGVSWILSQLEERQVKAFSVFALLQDSRDPADDSESPKFIK